MPWLWIVLISIGLYWYFTKKEPTRGQREIPGPKGLPLVGNALQLGKFIHLQFNKWSEEFGDIYAMKIGNQKIVVLSNAKMIKEIYSDSNWTGRPHIDGFDIYEDERLGIVNSEGELWEVHRRFLLRQLRDFGFGKSAMENLIFEELNEVLAKFKESEGKPVHDMKKILQLAVINALWAVVSCARFKHDDPKLSSLVDSVAKVMTDLFEKGASLVIFIPWLKHIIPEASGYNGFRRVFNQARIWFEETIAEHKQTLDENNIRDFIDVYLAEVKKTTDPSSQFYGARAERQLVATLSDLFFAGNDTTSTTLAWGIFYLCKNPDIQHKFQQEIESITSNSRPASVTDRPNMPYTVALIDEILRMSSIVPNGVQHRAIEDKEFQGYFIPKDAFVMPNMYYLHHDQKIWGDPDTFRPERFLSADGKYVKNENLIAFQVGRRQCVGETMARDTVFLYLTNIFQRFNVKFDPNKPEPTSEVLPTFLLNPQPYTVVMTDRLAN